MCSVNLSHSAAFLAVSLNPSPIFPLNCAVSIKKKKKNSHSSASRAHRLAQLAAKRHVAISQPLSKQLSVRAVPRFPPRAEPGPNKGEHCVDARRRRASEGDHRREKRQLLLLFALFLLGLQARQDWDKRRSGRLNRPTIHPAPSSLKPLPPPHTPPVFAPSGSCAKPLSLQLSVFQQRKPFSRVISDARTHSLSCRGHTWCEGSQRWFASVGSFSIQKATLNCPPPVSSPSEASCLGETTF